MSFLLDTDICSAYRKNNPRVVSKFMLHFGGLHLSVITVGELLTWAQRAKGPPSRLQGVRDLLKAATIHEVDLVVAEKFGELRAGLLDQGITVGEMDLLNVATALVHNLTLVTHNIQDYAKVDDLTREDWTAP
jgi:tRNA(fMet)-specific endonuclease VapC